MLRYIGMCVHIASIHSENLSLFIISLYPGPKQRGKKKPNQIKPKKKKTQKNQKAPKQPSQVAYHYRGVF